MLIFYSLVKLFKFIDFAGKYVLSSGRDSLVKLWEMSTTRCLIAYTGAGATGKQVLLNLFASEHEYGKFISQ